MGRLIELAERAERVNADEQREMLLAAYAAIHGMTLAARQYDTGVLGNNTSIDGRADADRFARFLAAEAYESAAMQLVPEGWHVGRLDEDWRTGSWEARLVVRPSEAQRKAFEAGRVISNRDSAATAPTAALAICASSLRARDGGSDGDA